MTTLAAQIDEAERTVREREHRYPDLVRRGRLKDETAARHITAMQAVAATLQWLAANEDWIRDVARQRRELAAERAAANELDALRGSPAVATLLAAFPGAEITAVRPGRAPDADDAFDYDDLQARLEPVE